MGWNYSHGWGKVCGIQCISERRTAELEMAPLVISIHLVYELGKQWQIKCKEGEKIKSKAEMKEIEKTVGDYINEAKT